MMIPFWTGPVFVKETAEAVREAGFQVVAGTERIYVEIDPRPSEEETWQIRERIIDKVRAKHGKDFGLRAVP